MAHGSNGNGQSSGRAGAAVGDAARAAYYDQLERVNKQLRAHLDTFGETIRRARRVETIDRSFTDREVALQLRLTATTYVEVADGLSPRLKAVRAADEITTETKRIKRGGTPDSSPGHKRS